MDMPAAMKGWWVANQVDTNGGYVFGGAEGDVGDGLGAGGNPARMAVLEVWAARAMAAPMAVAMICICGESWALA